MSNTVNTVFEKRIRAFPLGPDKTALFLGRDYRHALVGIRDGMAQGWRLQCLVGPAGIGKSMLLRTLRTQLPRGIISEISQPPLGGLLSRLAVGLDSGISGDDEAAVQQRFQEYFAAPRHEGIAVIQVIDDAESLTRDDLALARRLFESIQGQILLVGQPPLLSLFSADDGTPTEIQPDRIYTLEPLSPEEVGAYIRHRLNEAGFDRELFMPEAISTVNDYSGGLPRLINLLCFTALASSEFDVSTPIAAEHIHDAARQRMEIGNYPFMCPPLAPGWRPIPSLASGRDAREANRRHSDMDENIDFIGGALRSRSDRPARFGYGRILLSLVAGVALGIMISRMSVMGGVGQADIAPHASATAVSHPIQFSLQRMKAGLVDMAEWVISWAGPESTSANNNAIAQGDMPARSQTTPGPQAITGIQTPETAPTRPADVALVVDEEGTAPANPKKSASVATTASGQIGDSTGIAQSGQDDQATHLTTAQREHLAALYADRAQYDIQSDRLQDAQTSIRRGLRLAPDDARLLELNNSVVSAIAARQHEAPQQTEDGQIPPHATPSLPIQIVPPRKEITLPYSQQANNEWLSR
jgi:type II secretory pathway predicted ATPase ExeA